jgi:hypothetical protein
VNLRAFAFPFAEEKSRCPGGFSTDAREASRMQGDLSIDRILIVFSACFSIEIGTVDLFFPLSLL